jgi:hypothetical protein
LLSALQPLMLAMGLAVIFGLHRLLALCLAKRDTLITVVPARYVRTLLVIQVMQIVNLPCLNWAFTDAVLRFLPTLCAPARCSRFSVAKPWASSLACSTAPSIDCTKQKYSDWRVVAILVIVLYVFAAPLALFVALVRANANGRLFELEYRSSVAAAASVSKKPSSHEMSDFADMRSSPSSVPPTPLVVETSATSRFLCCSEAMAVLLPPAGLKFRVTALDSMGSLYEMYDSHAYWWECVCVCAAPFSSCCIHSQAIRPRCSSPSCTTRLCPCFCTCFMPFRKSLDNRLETLSLTLILLISITVAPFYASLPLPDAIPLTHRGGSVLTVHHRHWFCSAPFIAAAATSVRERVGELCEQLLQRNADTEVRMQIFSMLL